MLGGPKRIRFYHWWCRWGGAAFAVFFTVLQALLYWRRPWAGSLVGLALCAAMFPMWWLTHRNWKRAQTFTEQWIDDGLRDLQRRVKAPLN